MTPSVESFKSRNENFQEKKKFYLWLQLQPDLLCSLPWSSQTCLPRPHNHTANTLQCVSYYTSPTSSVDEPSLRHYYYKALHSDLPTKSSLSLLLNEPVSIRTSLRRRSSEDPVHTVYEVILQGVTFFMEYHVNEDTWSCANLWYWSVLLAACLI